MFALTKPEHPERCFTLYFDVDTTDPLGHPVVRQRELNLELETEELATKMYRSFVRLLTTEIASKFPPPSEPESSVVDLSVSDANENLEDP